MQRLQLFLVSCSSPNICLWIFINLSLTFTASALSSSPDALSPTGSILLVGLSSCWGFYLGFWVFSFQASFHFGFSLVIFFSWLIFVLISCVDFISSHAFDFVLCWLFECSYYYSFEFCLEFPLGHSHWGLLFIFGVDMSWTPKQLFLVSP